MFFFIQFLDGLDQPLGLVVQRGPDVAHNGQSSSVTNAPLNGRPNNVTASSAGDEAATSFKGLLVLIIQGK